MPPSTDTLTVDRAEQLVRQLTDGLVHITDTTGEFLLPLEDGTVVDTKGWNGWEWTHGVALTALAHHTNCSPSSSGSAYSRKTAMEWFESQYKITKGKGAPKNINTMAPFYCLASLLDDGGGGSADETWRGWCSEWAEWVMHELPRTKEGGFQHITYIEVNKDQLWDDTLMMTVIPLTKIGLLLNRPAYIEEAKFQFLLHIQYLMDTTTGLWFHGWEFTEPNSGHNFARALWARGNCWVTVAIPLFLSILRHELKSTDPVYRTLCSAYKRQVDALVRTQDGESGLWHTLMVDPSSYIESSAAAGFAAGIYMGIRMGLVKGDDYLKCADTALHGVMDCIGPDGELAHVSFGTGMGHDDAHYKNIPVTPMPYGQALAMAALVEWEGLQSSGK